MDSVFSIIFLYIVTATVVNQLSKKLWQSPSTLHKLFIFSSLFIYVYVIFKIPWDYARIVGLGLLWLILLIFAFWRKNKPPLYL